MKNNIEFFVKRTRKTIKLSYPDIPSYSVNNKRIAEYQ